MVNVSSRPRIVQGGLVLDVEKCTTRPADLLIVGDTITEVGESGMDAPEDAVIFDATDRLIIPGLVNAHTHGHGSLGKGLGDKWSLELLLNASPWAAAGFTLEDKHTAALLNAAEMVLKGCTAAYDMYIEFPHPSLEGLTAIGKAYSELGVRVVLAPMMGDTTLYNAIPGLLDALPEPHRSHVEKIRATPHAEHLAACGEMLENWPFDRDQVRPALGPTIPLHCSEDFIRGCRNMAEEYDVGVQMHLGESKVQAVSGMRRYGKTLTHHIDELGLLNRRFTGAHCIWLDGDDMKRLRDKGANVAHNPSSNLRLGSGIAPARELIELGVPMGVGTDGSVSSDNQNMFEAMRAAAFVSRIVTPNPEDWLGTWDVLRLGTMGGADVLGFGGVIGKVAPGYKADIVFLDLANVNFLPLNDAANQIVNCEDSSAVHSVMIGGRMVLEDRRFVDFDYDGLRKRVALATGRLREANADSRVRMEAMAEFVSHHCVGLACENYPVSRRLDLTSETA